MKKKTSIFKFPDSKKKIVDLENYKSTAAQISSTDLKPTTHQKSVERQQTGRESLRESVASMMVGVPMK